MKRSVCKEASQNARFPGAKMPPLVPNQRLGASSRRPVSSAHMIFEVTPQGKQRSAVLSEML